MLKKTFLQSVLILSLRNYRRNYRNIDPGIHKRKTAIEKEEKNIDYEEIDFDEWESDFMNVDKTHKELHEENHILKERLKYNIVKQKYFKTKYPNFLMWNEKQQIKYLYNTNSKEWTLDKLSESFPALPEVIEVGIPYFQLQ